MQLAKKPNQPIYVLLGIVAALMLIVGAFFSEGIAFFNPNWSAFMTDSEYFISLIAVLLCVSLFLFLAHRYFPIKQNFIFMGIAILLFAGNLVAMLAFPSVYQTKGARFVGEVENLEAFNLVYFLNDIDRVRYILTFGITCLYLYLMFVYFPQVYKNSRSINIYFIAALVVLFVSVVWSIWREWDKYVQFFKPDETKGYEVIESFFMNRNTYGTMILIGIIACAYLQTRSRHFYYYIIMVFFYLEQIFILSKTSIALSTVFVASFLLYRYIATVKRHWIKNNIALIIVLAIIGVSVWLVVSEKIKDIPYLGKAYEHVYNELFGSDFGTFRSREFIWKVCMRDMLGDPLRMIFGFGDGNYLRLLGYELESNMLKLGYPHNGVLAMFTYGGFLRLAIYAAMIIYIFVLMIINFTKKKNPHNVVCMISLFIVLGHSMVETTAFLGSDSKSLALMLVVFIPVLIDRYNDRHQEKNVPIREFSLSMAEKDAESRKETSRGHLFAPLFISSSIASTIILMYQMNPDIVTTTGLIYVGMTFLISVIVSLCFAYRTTMKKPWSVGIQRIIASLLIVAMYVLPLIFKGRALQLYAGLVGVLSLVITVLWPAKRAHNVKVQVIKPLLVTIAILLSGFVIGWRLSMATIELSQYTILVFVMIYDLLLLNFFIGIPLLSGNKESIMSKMFPGWFRYERASMLWGDKRDQKLADKIAKYKQKKIRKKKAVAQ